MNVMRLILLVLLQTMEIQERIVDVFLSPAMIVVDLYALIATITAFVISERKKHLKEAMETNNSIWSFMCENLSIRNLELEETNAYLMNKISLTKNIVRLRKKNHEKAVSKMQQSYDSSMGIKEQEIIELRKVSIQKDKEIADLEGKISALEEKIKVLGFVSKTAIEDAESAAKDAEEAKAVHEKMKRTMYSLHNDPKIRYWQLREAASAYNGMSLTARQNYFTDTRIITELNNELRAVMKAIGSNIPSKSEALGALKAQEQDKTADVSVDAKGKAQEQNKTANVSVDAKGKAQEQNKTANVSADAEGKAQEENKTVDVSADAEGKAQEQDKTADVSADAEGKVQEQDKTVDVSADAEGKAQEQDKTADVSVSTKYGVELKIPSFLTEAALKRRNRYAC